MTHFTFFFLSVSSQSVSFAVFLYLRSSRQLPVLQIYLFFFFTFLISLVLINCSIFEMFRIQEFHVSKDELLCRFLASPAEGAKMQLHDFSKSVNILCVLAVSHGVGKAHKNFPNWDQ